MSPAERSSVAIFMAEWAERLADWMAEILPENIAARARMFHSEAGIQLIAKRDARHARFEFPLNIFVRWQPDEIAAFLTSPLQHTIEFQARIRERLVRFGEPKATDFSGGSQQSPAALTLSLADLGVRL